MTLTIEMLRRAGVLSPLDVHFARSLARLAREDRPEVLLAVALASRQVICGHTCLHLARLAGTRLEPQDASGASLEPVADWDWPPVARWLALLHESPLVGGARDATPLVLDRAGRLYLRRYFEHESRLAAAVRERAAAEEEPVDAAALEAALDRLFPPAEVGGPDLQRAAARLAVRRRFAVISGGPGTGKTYTVVKILALLVEQALARGAGPPRLHLVAPTGKAAARLEECVRGARAGLPVSDTVKAAIPDEASTIHRLLGSVRGSSTRFRHGERTPLATDLVVVDEASMVDVALMSRLLAAVPAHARVLLLGDKDQLASVEAGSVLGDLCRPVPELPPSPGPGKASKAEEPPVPRLTLRAPASPPPIASCIVHLTRSYCYAEDSGIEALARAINGNDPDHALEILRAPSLPDVTLVPLTDPWRLPRELGASVLRGYLPYLAEDAPASCLRAFNGYRVLCAHRRGPVGVATLNAWIARLLREAGHLLPTSQEYYGHRPVMVTRNDYAQGLYNGDVAVLLGTPLRAWFVSPGGTERSLSPARLPPHETVFAMSIHKSQGSEFDRVDIVLPNEPSPLCTRELLYTAVTRARSRLALYASELVVRYAVTHRTVRPSGLADALWGRGAAQES